MSEALSRKPPFIPPDAEKLKLLRQLFSLTGSPDVASQERVAELIERLDQQADENIFYCLVDVRPGYGVPWTKNTETVLGRETFRLEHYFDVIHPQYIHIFTSFIKAIYKNVLSFPSGMLENGQYVITMNVPLLEAAGNCRWYSMVCSPVAFDRQGGLVQHLNRHCPIARYDRMLPELPIVTIQGKEVRAASQILGEDAGRYFGNFLEKELSAGGYRLLSAYRSQTVLAGGKWQTPGKADIMAATGLSSTALDRANVRLLRDIRTFYPAHAVRGITDLAIQFNELFGWPGNCSAR